ncbi:alpha/beta hydrolase [Aquimarina sp. AD10]|uniref:alpha/beta hydrolase n=1 Tax=Aquimarina sp. AD10 TaxID=1714849 RepID=UPI000E50296C|nr:alpha/beta hydrolase [Aquimarina sp. AD10]AXT62145.1 alpha/beta hydrolase [Aquimarina sp. AD10]RKM90660.1 alpha/beta hydrolase [Aquimarina sp. AD10]
MKPKLLLLSDLWGIENAVWIQDYLQRLESDFEIKVYDSCRLGEINTSSTLETKRHQQFIDKGIDNAVQKLLKLEKKKINILAFSIGGTIAWKAGLQGLDIDHFYSVSSTRLRYEDEIPKAKIKLYFGGDDVYKPNVEWFKKNEIDNKIYKNKAHHLYSEIDFITHLCTEIIDDEKRCV